MNMPEFSHWSEARLLTPHQDETQIEDAVSRCLKMNSVETLVVTFRLSPKAKEFRLILSAEHWKAERDGFSVILIHAVPL